MSASRSSSTRDRGRTSGLQSATANLDTSGHRNSTVQQTALNRRSRAHEIRKRVSDGTSRHSRFSRHSRTVFHKDRDEDSNSSTISTSESPLMNILKYQWKLYRVSPLYKFQYNKLKEYGRHVRNHLMVTRPDRKDYVEYLVKFTRVENLQKSDIDDAAIQIEVTMQVNRTHTRPVYLGTFLSWGKIKQRTPDDFVDLPLLLCKGSLRCSNNVHDILQKMFDCVIHPLEINTQDLLWLSTITNIKTPTKRPTAELHFMCPLVPLGKILLAFNVDELQELWSRIHDPDENQVRAEEVWRFHKHVSSQLEMTFQLEEASFVMSFFDFPNLMMTIDGRMKVRTVEAAEYALSYLCSSACILESCNPGLSRDMGEDN